MCTLEIGKKKKGKKKKTHTHTHTYPFCILGTLMPHIIPLLTLTLVHMWYEESTRESNPPGIGRVLDIPH